MELLNLKTEYQYTFRRIRGKSDKQHKDRKVYFGRVFLSEDNVTKKENQLFIELYAFNKWIKNDEKSNPNYKYSIAIDLTELNNYEKAKILNKLTFATIDQKKNKDKEIEKKAHVFFLGDPPKENNPYLFTIYKNYMICRYDEVLPEVNSRK